ncbi:unnamed protein product [Prunus armeniaca]|uniref:Uncharacterized protein n=1 Tax=Prunus armeniaca TaxID=36596 RepID=A0A6J5V8I2_PRUAR|nr:unnamed protein product [Prunus armeniaca]CAB4314501.1 unnamed protein product [Prunus armeniaca]
MDRLQNPQNPQLLQTEAVADAIQRLWPICKAIFDLRAWDKEVLVQMQIRCEFTH